MKDEILENLLNGLEYRKREVNNKNFSSLPLIAYLKIYEQIGILIYKALETEKMYSNEIVYPCQSLQQKVYEEIELKFNN